MSTNFIKLSTGQKLEAVLQSPNPAIDDGQWGKKHLYTFTVNGIENTLSLSEDSPATKDIQNMKAGDPVVIKKEPTAKGSVWVVVHANDITNSIPDPEPPPVPPPFEPTKEEVYELKQQDKDLVIARLAICKAVCELWSGTGETEKAIESAKALEKYVYNQ